MSKKKDKIKESIARIFLMCFLVMLLGAGCLLSVAGDYTPWLIVMGGCLVQTLLLGSQKIRIHASLGLVLTLILIFVDYQCGKALNKVIWDMKKRNYTEEIEELKVKLQKDERHNKSLHRTAEPLCDLESKEKK